MGAYPRVEGGITYHTVVQVSLSQAGIGPRDAEKFHVHLPSCRVRAPQMAKMVTSPPNELGDVWMARVNGMHRAQ